MLAVICDRMIVIYMQHDENFTWQYIKKGRIKDSYQDCFRMFTFICYVPLRNNKISTY